MKYTKSNHENEYCICYMKKLLAILPHSWATIETTILLCIRHSDTVKIEMKESLCWIETISEITISFVTTHFVTFFLEVC